MGLVDYIKPSKTITADEYKDMIKNKNIDDYQLIDVRQLKEYEDDHIPGAVLVPLGELEKHLGEFSTEKLTVAYCAIGGRSRAAASILSEAGIKEVYSLKGGIKAWNGITTQGPPDSGFVRFQEAIKTEEIIAISWAFEEGSKRFYDNMANKFKQTEAEDVFKKLSTVEEHHKTIINELYYKSAAKADIPAFPDYYKTPDEAEEIIEGGLKLEDAVKWAKEKSLKDVLDFSMSMEAQQYDLYMRLARVASEEKTKETLKKIAQEEKKHLEKLAGFFETIL